MRRNLVSTGVWVGAYLLFTVLIHRSTGQFSFLNAANLELVLRQTAIVGTAALGMTLIIAAGGIDLSAGAVIALTTVVVASALNAGWSPLWAGALGIAAGAVAGIVNGVLITLLGVVPFIVTLGTMLAVRGVAKGLAHEQKIDAPSSWLNDGLAVLPADRRWLLFPPGVWLMVLLALLVAVLLNYTRFGRHVLAVGSNPSAARLAGVPVERVKRLVYLFGGLFGSIAGVLQYGRLSVGDPTVATGLELDVIAAVVIGGASLAGGEAWVFGSVLGALIMTTIRAGGSQLGWSNWVQEIVTGTIIISAVAVDRMRHRGDA